MRLKSPSLLVFLVAGSGLGAALAVLLYGVAGYSIGIMAGFGMLVGLCLWGYASEHSQHQTLLRSIAAKREQRVEPITLDFAVLEAVASSADDLGIVYDDLLSRVNEAGFTSVLQLVRTLDRLERIQLIGSKRDHYFLTDKGEDYLLGDITLDEVDRVEVDVRIEADRSARWNAVVRYVDDQNPDDAA